MRLLRTLAFSQGRGLQFVRPLPLGEVPDEVWEEQHHSGIAWWRDSVPIFGEALRGRSSNEIDSFSLQGRLVRALSYGIDGVIFPTFKRAGTQFIPTSATQGRFNLSSGPGTKFQPALMTSKHLKRVTGYLGETLQAAPYDDQWYMGLASHMVVRMLHDDPAFQNWRQYLKRSMAFYAGETGMAGNTRLIDVSHRGHLGVGEMIVFGNDPMGMLEGEAPALLELPSSKHQLPSWRWTGLLGFVELVADPSGHSPIVVVPGGSYD